MLYCGKISSDDHQGSRSQEQSVAQTHFHLLEGQADLLAGRKVLVHQHPDSDSQGLGPRISRHIQDKGLEAYNDGNGGHHLLENTHNGRDADTQKKEGDQPGKTLLHALSRLLLQIFL